MRLGLCCVYFSLYLSLNCVHYSILFVLWCLNEMYYYLQLIILVNFPFGPSYYTKYKFSFLKRQKYLTTINSNHISVSI